MIMGYIVKFKQIDIICDLKTSAAPLHHSLPHFTPPIMFLFVASVFCPSFGAVTYALVWSL
jgi:hypothetical protein